jgi:lipopolysaccharide export system protein LptC
VSEENTPRPFVDYSPRRESVLGRGYTRLVKALRFILPLVAVIIIAVLITRLTQDPKTQTIADVPQAEKTTPGVIELIAPKYEGLDSDGQPYTVTADKAVRSPSAPDTVVFENPVADITLKDKTWLAIKAKGGSFDRKAALLLLNDTVTLYHDSGYEMKLQDIKIDLKEKTAVSDFPLTAQGPMGGIAAQNMHVENHGDLVVFGGPVTLTLYKLSSPTPPKVRG